MTLLPLVAATIAIASACAPKHGEEARQAAIIGHEMAMRLHPDSGANAIRCEALVLDVRDREKTLRANGYDDAADSLVQNFIFTLDSVNPSISRFLRLD